MTCFLGVAGGSRDDIMSFKESDFVGLDKLVAEVGDDSAVVVVAVNLV